MGTLSADYEEPAFWDGQRERRIFIAGGDFGLWGIYWMRGYCGENTKNRFKSVPLSPERQFVEGHVRRMAKEKGWSEMERCPKCRLLHHSGTSMCHMCRYSRGKGRGNG